MSQDAIRTNLALLGLPNVAEATLHVACEQFDWFPAAVEQAAEFARSGQTEDLLPYRTRIRSLLRAASTATADLLQRLDTCAGVREVFECAQQHPQFFPDLAAYSRGDVERGRRAAAALAPFLNAPVRPAPQEAPPVPREAGSHVDGPVIPPSVPAPFVAPQDGCPQPCQQHVYAAKGALALATRRDGDGEAVLLLDAAAVLHARQYDWRHKISMALNMSEALLLFAVLTGLLPSVEVVAKAPVAKRLKLDDQGGRFTVRMSHGQRVVVVTLAPLDALRLALGISDPLVSTHPQLSDMEGLRRFAAPFVARLALPAAA